MSLDLTKNISQLVKSQFPSFYAEEGEMFIAFVKAYYEWLESDDQALYHSRRLSEYKDIDRTIEDFILDFKNKYLVNVQFNVATNKRLFVKNALEFYRAKGTPRAVDLFFKLIYGLEAKVYEPGRDLFRLSDNTWNDERYVELKPAPNNLNFVGKQVFGSVSGASAFAEKLTKVKNGATYIDVLYLSGLSGTFITGEDIVGIEEIEDRIARNEGDAEKDFKAKVIGSLSALKITTSDPNFIVGEELFVKTGSGKKARAVVTAVQNLLGVVDFNLVHGGWGYNANSAVLSSDRTLQMTKVVFENDDYFYHNSPFEQFKNVKQDCLRFFTSDADAFTLDLGTQINIHQDDDSANTVVFDGILVAKSESGGSIDVNFTKSSYSNTSDGSSFLTSDSRELTPSNTSLAQVNTIFANVSSNSVAITLKDQSSDDNLTTDVSFSGNVVGTSNTCTIQYTTSDTDTALVLGETFYQTDPEYGIRFAEAEVVAGSQANATGNFVNLQMTRGYFRSNVKMFRSGPTEEDSSTNIEYTITGSGISNVSIGMTGLSGTLRLFSNTYTSNTSLGTHAPGSVDNVTGAQSTKATIKLSSFDQSESHSLIAAKNVDGNPFLINEIPLSTVIDMTEDIDSAAPANSQVSYIAGGNTIFYTNTALQDALGYETSAIELGSVAAFSITNPGSGYGTDPFFLIYDQYASGTERYDFYIRYKSEGADDTNKSFRVGEVISVSGKLGEARIEKFNQSTREIFATRLHFTVDDANTAAFWTSDDFRNDDTFTGSQSGISAVIEEVNETRQLPRTGRNADLQTSALSGNGFASEVRITNSGFGFFGKKKDNSIDAYVKGEDLVLASVNSASKEITASGYLTTNGIAPGYHPNRKSFLSSDKYILDSEFFQEYSYQVLTALPFSQYKDTLVNVLHLAGSKPFGGYRGTSEVSVDISPTSVSSQFEIKNFGLFINQNTFYSANVA